MNFLFLLLISSVVVAQEMTLKQAQDTILSKSAFLDKLEVGMSGDRTSWIRVKPSGCQKDEKEIETIIALPNGEPVVLKEYSLVDPCENQGKSFKYIEQGVFKLSHQLIQHLEKTQKDAKVTLSGNLLSFYRIANGESFQMQFQLNVPLFFNWVHFHQDMKKDERHNIRNQIMSRVVSAEEITGLEFCQYSGATKKCQILTSQQAEDLLK